MFQITLAETRGPGAGPRPGSRRSRLRAGHLIQARFKQVDRLVLGAVVVSAVSVLGCSGYRI